MCRLTTSPKAWQPVRQFWSRAALRPCPRAPRRATTATTVTTAITTRTTRYPSTTAGTGMLTTTVGRATATETCDANDRYKRHHETQFTAVRRAGRGGCDRRRGHRRLRRIDLQVAIGVQLATGISAGRTQLGWSATHRAKERAQASSCSAGSER